MFKLVITFHKNSFTLCLREIQKKKYLKTIEDKRLLLVFNKEFIINT